MDNIELKRLVQLGSKPEYRAMMRDLSMPEKVRVVVELQKIAAPILRARGREVYVWKLPDESADAKKENEQLKK